MDEALRGENKSDLTKKIAIDFNILSLYCICLVCVSPQSKTVVHSLWSRCQPFNQLLAKM